MIDNKVEDSGGISASIFNSWIKALEIRLLHCLYQMGTLPLSQPHVEVNHIYASVAPVAMKSNESFIGLSISVFPKLSNFLRRPTD